MAKTGTSSFQSFAWHNRDQLAAAGLTYCRGFRRRHHVELAIAFSTTISGLTRADGVANRQQQLEVRRRLPEMLGDPRSAPAFLASSEHLTTLVRDPADIAALAELLRSMYDEVTVLVVVRRADYWLPSAYVESIKAGDRRPANQQFVTRRGFVLDHQALFRRWGDAFGHENVLAVPFLESDKTDPIRLPTRILQAAGVPDPGVQSWPLPPRAINMSLSAHGTEVLRAFNNQRKEKRDTPMSVLAWRRRVLKVVRRMWPGPTPVIPLAAAEELHERGWVRTGIGDSRYAWGDGWAEWTSQPDAPAAPLVKVPDSDVRALVKELRRLELVDRSWLRLAPRRAKRRVRRLLGRRSP
jgi:hypothetical protein